MPEFSHAATAQEFLQMKRDQELIQITNNQNESLSTFKNAEQKLDAFNRFSQARYQNVHKQFEAHTKLLKEVKGDLDSVFRKINTIKRQLASVYPKEMDLALKKYPPKVVADDEDDDDEE
ncbi:hypothetical protein BDF20DRAFT_913905 [Mycotypha africana]|uniref:uncharacterized protein n=1 Tax=Mycotypha africana TaxID=64632 RepID=UPI0023018235|nr:uncharacterized protein BDF20DRAFT_913905 [Mycotypha africana]KAI8977590.1 hypothetical protein BDF20DRAFT_913905 [Mycotypha africana]